MAISSVRRLTKPIWLCLSLVIILCVGLFFLSRSFKIGTTEENILIPIEQHKSSTNHNFNRDEKSQKTSDRIQVKMYPKYYEDNLRSGWPFKISRTYDANQLHEWSQPTRFNVKSERWTRGENGTAFAPESQAEYNTIMGLYRKHNFNLYASEHMSLHRTLPDIRFAECHGLKYPERLPKVSIIIIFHNEAWSLVMRTIWSIIDHSPPELLHELILVDDVSTFDVLKRPLEDYIQLLPVNIRIIRTERREGLIRARLIGAGNATGSILIFFDAHMECLDGWLEPLVARIANDRSVIAVPYIDRIDKLEMSYLAPNSIFVNNLRWSLFFNWEPIPERELKRIKYDKTAPVRTPTHVGCAFAIDREFFYEIGSYDTGMDIWGSENVEMAIRVWMCGGSLEILPCSRVGHLFRTMTYSFDGDKQKITARNNVRLVEVWLDEFKYFFYASQRPAHNVSTGDITSRENLRKELKCKNFRWYLENIYPESSWLKEYYHMGEIRSAANETLCLDLYDMLVRAPLLVWWCTTGENQFFALAKSGHLLMAEEYCVGIAAENSVQIVRCSETDNSQLWAYDVERQWLIHRASHLCLQSFGFQESVRLATCNIMDKRFQWNLVSTIPEKLAIKL